ncbi:MAG: hypothetical protein AAFV53_00515 [Myxococcota bacterium]
MFGLFALLGPPLGSIGHADPPITPPITPPVVQRVSGGTIDWSTLKLEVVVKSQLSRGAWQDRKLQEQDALDRLNRQITAIARKVPVTPTVTAGELIDDGGDLGDRLTAGLRRWSVEETRYHNRGGVELVGTLDLRTWLWPALASMSTEAGQLSLEGAQATGLVIDARGLAMPLSISPVVAGPSGPLMQAQDFSEEAARRRAPVLYVTDPADPRAAARAGDNPVLVRAERVDEDSGALILSPQTSARLTQSGALDAVANTGNVVIVIQ